MYLKPSRRKKIKTRTMLILIGAGIAVAVIVIMTVMGMLPQVSMLSGNVHTLDTALPESVLANENGILYTQNDVLYLRDSLGNEVWEQELEMQDANTVASSELICNYAAKSIQVLTYSKEQMFNTAIDNDIIEAAAGNANVAILTEKENEQGEVNYSISLFNTKGEPTGQISLEKRQVLKFGFHGDTDMFWVLTLDVSGIIPYSYITTYKADGNMTNSIPVSTQVVEDVFVTDNAIFLSGTNALTSYTYFGDKQVEQHIYGWYPTASSVTAQSVKLAYIPRSTVQDIDAAAVYSTDLSSLHIRLPRNVIALAITQTRLYAFTADTIHVYMLDGGNLDKKIALDSKISKVKQVSDACAVLWDAEKSYLIDLV